MLNGQAIVAELLEMVDAPPDLVAQRAVQRIHEQGAPFDWVGIYLLSGDLLVLHSYLGLPTDLTRIRVGDGVCGTAVAEGRHMNVPDVKAVDYYLACSAETRSEIVVLIRHAERILGVIDIDSDTPAAFGEDHERELRRIADALGGLLGPRLR